MSSLFNELKTIASSIRLRNSGLNFFLSAFSMISLTLFSSFKIVESVSKPIDLPNEFALFAKEKNCTPAQLAISWVINQSDNIIPIPGTKRRKYLEENASAVDVSLNLNDLEKIENIFTLEIILSPLVSAIFLLFLLYDSYK